MNRRPMPFLLICLPLILLALNQQPTIANIAWGTGLSIFLCWVVDSSYFPQRELKQITNFLRLFTIVFFDIVKSSLDLFILTAFYPKKDLKPCFMSLQLRLRTPYSLAALACIMTYVPGSIWLILSEDYVLTLHIFNFRDQSHLENIVKNHYEHLLIKIFE